MQDPVDELYARICEIGRPVDAVALNAGIGAAALHRDMAEPEGSTP